MIYLNNAKTANRKKIFDARKLLLVEKKYLESITLLSALIESSSGDDLYLVQSSLALAYFENKDYSAAAGIYESLSEPYQQGFCELLQNNVEKAKKIWYSAEKSEAICWGRCLVDFVNLDVCEIPSFIQVRNHLESDIGYFIKSGNLDYASNLVKLADFFVDINLESYKYIGKALVNAGYSQLAVNYFYKGVDIIPQDSENYYHIAQYLVKNKSYPEAINMLKDCLSYNPHFTPAMHLIEVVKKLIQG